MKRRSDRPTLMPRRATYRCNWCGRTIYEFRDHLPRCPALERPKG